MQKLLVLKSDKKETTIGRIATPKKTEKSVVLQIQVFSNFKIKFSMLLIKSKHKHK